MQEHVDTLTFAGRAAWIVGPIVIVLTALRVAYLRSAGVRTTGTAVATRREARTRTVNDSNGRNRWETYYVDVTDVSYADRAGNRYHCTVDGRYDYGTGVPLVFTSRSPDRAMHASAASYSRVLVAIVGFAVLVLALAYARQEVADDIDRFCSGLSADARAFHDC
ncbi:hypothetical protein OG216_40350 [Streptomycetaceae bacterium NBC_01309]